METRLLPNLSEGMKGQGEPSEEESRKSCNTASLPRDSFDLMRLPIGVVEQIFWYLDGASVLVLRDMSATMERYVDEVLAGKIGRSFWLKRCLFEAPRSQVIKTLASYRTSIQPYCRGIPECPDISSDFMLNHKWRHIYVAMYKLRERCSGPLEVTRFTRLQNWLKNEVKMTFKETAATATYPIKLTSTSGSTFYQVRSPCSSLDDQEHLYIFEDMSEYRRGVKVLGGREKVRSVKTIILPVGLKPSEFTGDTFPKPGIVVIIATTNHISLTSLHQGVLIRVPLELPREYRSFPHLRSENRYAVWGEKLGVWKNPDTVLIYSINVDPKTSDVSATIIKRVVFMQQLHHLWAISALESKTYLTALRLKFKNPYVSSSDDIPVFSFLSPTLDSYEVHYGNFNPDTDETCGKLESFPPNMTGIHRVSPAIGYGHFTGCQTEQNMVIFWNSNWLAVLYSRIWIYQQLPLAILSSSDETLLEVECQTEKVFLFGTNHHLYIILLNYFPPRRLVDPSGSAVYTRGQIHFEIIRKIPLVSFLPSPEFVITHIHYDMDRGRPYIFVAADLPPQNRTAFSYELMKLEFEQSEEELEEQFGHLKTEEAWSV